MGDICPGNGQRLSGGSVSGVGRCGRGLLIQATLPVEATVSTARQKSGPSAEVLILLGGTNFTRHIKACGTPLVP
jgi:hypothetical protein